MTFIESGKNSYKQSKSDIVLFTKKKVLIGILLCSIIMSALFYYVKIYEGKFDVELVENSFELGETKELIKTLKINSKSIRDLSIIDDGGFTTDEIGDYTVIYDATNDRGNHREFVFTYHVLDTIAPTVELLQSEIYLSKGGTFAIEQYTTARDISDTSIEYEGTFDINSEGSYDIEVFATDSSGNISEKKALHIIVEDRSDCDIRKANFGENKETVRRYETSELLYEGDNFLMYQSSLATLNNMKADLVYIFNSKNELVTVGYSMNDSLVNHELYVTQYDELVDTLDRKYGAADDRKKYDNSGGLSEGTALWLGYYARQDEWYLDNMTVRTLLQSTESNKITFNCVYYSTIYKKDEMKNDDL